MSATVEAERGPPMLLATKEVLAFVEDDGWVPGPTLLHFQRSIDPAAPDRLAERPPGLWARVCQVATPLRFTLREGRELLAAAALRELELVPHFDARADEIWRGARADYGVISDRSWATLARRFDADPRRQLLRVYLLAHGRPVGYFVLGSRFVRGVCTSAVVDFLAPPRWLPALLVGAVLYAHETHSALLEVRTNDGVAGQCLRALGFRSDQARQVQAKLPPGLGDPAALPPPRAWFLTAVDVITLDGVDLSAALAEGSMPSELRSSSPVSSAGGSEV